METTYYTLDDEGNIDKASIPEEQLDGKSKKFSDKCLNTQKRIVRRGGKYYFYNEVPYEVQKSDEINSSVIDLNKEIKSLKDVINQLSSDANELRKFAAKMFVGTTVAVVIVLMAFAQFQSSWLQKSLDRTWEITMRILDEKIINNQEAKEI